MSSMINLVIPSLATTGRFFSKINQKFLYDLDLVFSIFNSLAIQFFIIMCNMRDLAIIHSESVSSFHYKSCNDWR